MKGPVLGPGGEDITWPDQVAPRGRKASSTREIKPQTSNSSRMFQSGAAAAICLWMIQSEGRRLVLLFSPRITESGASVLISPDDALGGLWLLVLVLPRKIQSRVPHGLVTASPHHHILVLVSALLHHHRLHRQNRWRGCVLLSTPRRVQVLLGTASRVLVVCGWCLLSQFEAPVGRCCLTACPVSWLWLAVCLCGVPLGPALVRRASSGGVALRAPVGCAVTVVPSRTAGFCLRIHGAAARGTWRPAEANMNHQYVKELLS